MGWPERVAEVLGQFQDRVFLIDARTERMLTYGEIHRSASGLAIVLRDLGVRRGDRVGALLDNSPEFVTLYFASLYVGATVVPLNPQLHPREIGVLGQTSAPQVLVYSPATQSLVEPLTLSDPQRPILCLAARRDSPAHAPGGQAVRSWSPEEPVGASGGWHPFDGVQAADLFTVTYTSGTTGLPKGVAHRIDGLLGNAAVFNNELGFTPESRFYHVLPMAYMAGFLNTLLCPFLAGASVVLDRPFDGRLALQFWEAPARHQVNTLWLVPTILSALLRVDRGDLGPRFCRESIKTVCVGTAPLPLSLKRAFEEKYGVELFESYGLSETLLTTTNSRKHERLPRSVGRPLPGVDLKIAAEDGRLLPGGQDGEIWVRTPFLMAGYLDAHTLQPDAATVGEWFPTGDVGHLGPTGDLFITGRKKDLIIRGGVNVSPRAVEELLLGHEAVADVAVVGLPHDLYGEEVVAVVTLRGGYTWSGVQPALERLCRENLSVSAVPTRFFEQGEIPKGATGKVQKDRLRKDLAALVGPKPEP